MKFIHYTNRLILRVLDSSWGRKVCQFYIENKDHFEPFEPKRVPTFYSVDFQTTTLAYEYNEFLHFRFLRMYLFEHSHPERIIGCICFNDIRMGSFLSCNIGYKIDYRFEGQGYTTEALNYAIHQIMFKEYRLHRIEASVHPANIPSIRIMQKLGFEKEGIAKDFAILNNRWEDHIKYALINKK